MELKLKTSNLTDALIKWAERRGLTGDHFKISVTTSQAVTRAGAAQRKSRVLDRVKR